MRSWLPLTLSFVLAFAAGVGGCQDTGTSEGIGTRDCAEAKTADQCANAENEAEGGSCSWLQIHELTLVDGACTFVETNEGLCVGASGLDDGCDFPLEGTCDFQDPSYYRQTGPNSWEMAQGAACRGVPGFDLCETLDDVPCSCSCELP